MTELIIDRERWLRGGDDAWLRDVDSGKMCCLGFEALRRGLTVEEINEITSPEETPHAEKWCGLVDEEGCNTRVCKELMTINDSIASTEEYRETEITRLFSTIGVDVRFVGEKRDAGTDN